MRRRVPDRLRRTDRNISGCGATAFDRQAIRNNRMVPASNAVPPTELFRQPPLLRVFRALRGLFFLFPPDLHNSLTTPLIPRCILTLESTAVSPNPSQRRKKMSAHRWKIYSIVIAALLVILALVKFVLPSQVQNGIRWFASISICDDISRWFHIALALLRA